MQKGQAHAKKRRTNPILLLVILALVVFLGVELIRVGKRLNEAAQQQAALERQLQQQTQENQALESDLAKKDDEEFIKDLARDQLGLAEAGERIFYDVNDWKTRSGAAGACFFERNAAKGSGERRSLCFL